MYYKSNKNFDKNLFSLQIQGFHVGKCFDLRLLSFLCSNRLVMKSTWFIRLMTDVGLEPLLKLIQRFIVIWDKFLTHYSIYKAHLDNRQIWWHLVFFNFEDFFLVCSLFIIIFYRVACSIDKGTLSKTLSE